MDSFAYMIIDQSNLVSVYENIPFKTRHEHFRYIDPVEILSIVQNSNLRFNRFEDVHIALDHDAFTYVPRGLFEHNAWFDYLNFVSSGTQKDDVVATGLEQDAVCVYTYPLSLRKLLSTLYPTSQVHHLSESLLWFLEREISDEPVLFSILHGEDQYLIVFENKKKTLINRYRAPGAQDQLYYILAACKHRKLNPRKVNIKITANLGIINDLKEELSRYFIHVSSIDWKNGWRLPLTVKNPMDLFEFYCMHHANHWG
jgi:hypothetical protein